MKKTKTDVRRFWYSDKLVMPMPVSIITSVNHDGVVNAAPYSLIMPYDVSGKGAQILVGLRRSSHTCKNIRATKEFVLNFPSADYIDDINEVFRFYPEGVSELDYCRFTTVDSAEVGVPSILECCQHIECRLAEYFEVSGRQARIIGDIAAIVMNDDLVDAGRGERIARMNLPVYMGDEYRKVYYYGSVKETVRCDTEPVPRKKSKESFSTSMPWDDDSLAGLEQVPDFVRQIVVERLEEEARELGLSQVTYESFLKLLKEYAPPDILERFRS
ncbi:flavin reductase family protein [Thermodesulfobacteriota bacterium]